MIGTCRRAMCYGWSSTRAFGWQSTHPEHAQPLRRSSVKIASSSAPGKQMNVTAAGPCKWDVWDTEEATGWRGRQGLVLRGLARGGLSLASERPTRNLAGAVHQAQCQRPGTCRGSGGHRAPAPCQTLKNLARSLAGVVIYGPDPRWQTCSKTCSNTLIV